MNLAEPPLVAFAQKVGKKWYRLPVITDRHKERSGKMILEAAGKAHARQAIILGGGRCEEIPLAQLIDRFSSVAINDMDGNTINEALAASGLAPNQLSRISRCVQDLTGVTELLVRQMATILATCESDSPGWAAENLASLVNGVQVSPFMSGLK
jgi:hypothetical protein